MNWDEFEGNWKVLKGKVREKWGKLTDDDLDQIDGQREQLIGTLQARYGKTRAMIERELNEFCSTYSCDTVAKTSRHRV